MTLGTLTERRKSIPVRVGEVVVGGAAPIAVQTMTKTDTRDVRATLNQIAALKEAGCEIVRPAVPDHEAAEALKEIVAHSPLPVIADRLVAKERPYPLHLGVTESGPVQAGSIRSAVGLGILLAEGIGDTIRVSLATDDPTEEVRAAYEVLKALDYRNESASLIACPTCGRRS